MRERGLLYFALGVTSVLSLGAVTNQVQFVPTSGLALSDTGITFPDGTVQTTAASGDPRRAFYMTLSQHNGDAALTACAPGFHMASIYEILDVSNLRYASDSEGGNNVYRRADSGVGPPSGHACWVRTGYDSVTQNLEGRANCAGWSSANASFWGTTAELEEVWNFATGTGDPSQIIPPWDSSAVSCAGFVRVWCVQD